MSDPPPRFPRSNRPPPHAPHPWPLLLLIALALAAGCTAATADCLSPADPASCAGLDGAAPGPELADLGTGGRSAGDLRGQPPGDLAASPLRGAVGPKGGSVSRLFFGLLGDARPSQCNEHLDYPVAITQSIFSRLDQAGVQFAVDLGDHMFVCQNGSLAEATTQMGLFMQSARRLGKTTFLTLGNHDCVSMNNPSYCGNNGFSTPNYQAFLSALRGEGIADVPWYSFDVDTEGGLARFVVIADNAWSPAQQSWLTATLADADARCRYIFLFRHHPIDNTDWPAFATISQIIRGVKHRTLTVTGHLHEFKIDTRNDPTARTVVVGNGGAPLAQGFGWFGYGTVEQLASGNIAIRLYDQASGNQMSAYQLTPQ